MKKGKVSSVLKNWPPWSVSIFFFLAIYFYWLVVSPAPAVAGPLYDHYNELKSGYPQFFDRLLSPPEKYNLTDQQLQDWLGDVDDKLAGDPEVINSSNFSSKLTNALLNTLFLPENEAVRSAVFAEYGEGILSGAYGSRQGAGSFAGAADVNKDGCVDLADLGWLASNYGAVGD